MRHIDRLAAPAMLVQRATQWQAALDAKVPPPARPDNTKYGHQAIRSTLNSMSSTKCFYCETKLKGVSKEIDHFIEFAIDRQGAYRWENLYLSCENCNNKFDENAISTTICLDPCIHTDAEIQAELTFRDEVILPKNNSQRGRRTITKYKLDEERLDYLRMRELQQLHKMIIRIQADNGGIIPDQEKQLLLSFTEREHQYSLMFKVALEALL